jgi:formylglycine-generating enzyme required for sulfatase activity
MRLRFIVILGMALVLMVTASQGEWRMRVHNGEQTEEFLVSGVDSLSFYNFAVTPGYVFIPAGTFMMGSPLSEPFREDNEEPHTVTLTKSFEMSATPVTNQEYLEAVQWAYDNGYVTATITSVQDNLDGSTRELLILDVGTSEIQFDGTGSFFLREAGGYAQTAYPDGYDPTNHPVLEVTWYGAVAYCDWLSLQAGLTRAYDHGTWSCNDNDPYHAEGYRLPTEAEWEYACRAGTITPFNTGECLDAGTEANFNGNFPYHDCPSGSHQGWTVEVSSYPANIWGLFNMHGNLHEWCNDMYGVYSGDETDPVGSEYNPNRVIRSGDWGNDGQNCRSAKRGRYYSNLSNCGIGFRTARSTD